MKESNRGAWIGWVLGGGFLLSIVLYFWLYLHEMDPDHEWPPRHYDLLVRLLGPNALAYVNSIILVLFMVALLYRTTVQSARLTHGLFFGFMISLILEMFGFPLAIYLISSKFGFPLLGHMYMQRFGHLVITVGMAVTFVGLVIVAVGWLQLFRSHAALASGGIYRFVRHPQYLGIWLFSLGWLLHWPTVLTLALFPFLTAAYYWAAVAEEKHMVKEYGQAYLDYMEKTGRFLPTRWS